MTITAPARCRNDCWAPVWLAFVETVKLSGSEGEER